MLGSNWNQISRPDLFHRMQRRHDIINITAAMKRLTSSILSSTSEEICSSILSLYHSIYRENTSDIIVISHVSPHQALPLPYFIRAQGTETSHGYKTAYYKKVCMLGSNLTQKRHDIVNITAATNRLPSPFLSFLPHLKKYVLL